MQDTSQSGGDISGALAGVQQAYQYGMQQLSGNIPTTPAGPGGDQTQGGPQDRGNQQIAMDTTGMRPSTNVEDDREASGIGAANQPMPKQGMTPGGVTQGGFGSPQIPQQQFPSGGTNSNTGVYPYNQTIQPMQGARGGSVPSLADGGVMPPPAAPQPQQPTPPPAGGGVQGNAPPQIMRYLTGADAAPIPQVLRRQKSMDPKLPPAARTAHTIASAGGPQQQYATLQAFRRLSDAAGTHAKVALSGNGKIPASLNHAVMFANKKFEYAPSPLHIQFNLKGQKQQAARGGGIQSFDDGGDVGPDPSQQLSDAGAPSQAPSSDSQAPITMQATDLQSGQTAAQDITPQQLNTILGQTYDNILQIPQQSQGSLEDRLEKFFPGLAGVERGGQYSPPGEGDIASQAQPDWGKLRQTGLPGGTPGENFSTSPGQPTPDEEAQIGQSTTGISGENPYNKSGLSSGQPTPEEARGIAANQNWGPVGERPAPEIQVWNPDTGKWDRMAPEEYDAMSGKDPTIPVKIMDPNSPGQWKTISTQDFNNNFETITQRYPTRGTKLDMSGGTAGGGGQPTVIRAGVPNNASAGERQNLIRAGQQSSSDLNQRMIQSTAAASQREQEAMSQQGETERTAMQIRAAKEGGGSGGGGGGTSGRRRRRRRFATGGAVPNDQPRRVYGRGHAGLGTYQEMPNGQALFLGAQDVTGGASDAG